MSKKLNTLDSLGLKDTYRRHIQTRKLDRDKTKKGQN